MRYKYPRTYHLPWSEGRSRDDLLLKDIQHFIGKRVIVTEKLDGENTSLYQDYLHARSLDSQSHVSRNWITQLQAIISADIPAGWRICGENLFAKHSIKYSSLKSYFYVFGIYNENNYCLPYDETKQWAEMLGLNMVPELYRGEWNEDIIKKCFTGISKVGGEQEGYVVRIEEGFKFEDHNISTAKFVRTGHIQSEDHWMYKEIEKNILEE